MGMNLLAMMEIHDVVNMKAIEDGTMVDAYTALMDFELDERLEKGMLFDWLVSTCGSMDTPWDNFNLYLYKHRLFFKVHSVDISRYADTVYSEYEWSDNYRMDEQEKRRLGRNESRQKGRDWGNKGNESVSRTETATSSGSENDNGSSSDTRTPTITEETENLVSAFNENLYQPREKTITKAVAGNEKNENSNTKEIHSSDHEESTGNENRSKKDSGAEIEGELTGVDESEGKNRFIHGSTGIYSLQDLAEKERRLADGNIYNWIRKKYMECMVYLIY